MSRCLQQCKLKELDASGSVRMCIARARHHGDLLLRLRLSVDEVGDAACLVTDDQQEIGCFWSDATSEHAFAGSFVAAARLYAEAAATDTLQQRVRGYEIVTLDVDGRVVDDAGIPTWIGGFRFNAPSERQKSVWGDWPLGTFWVPQTLVHCHKNRRCRYITVPVMPNDCVDSVLARLDAANGQARIAANGKRNKTPACKKMPCEEAVRANVSADAERPRWESLAARARDQICSGLLDKVVLARVVAYERDETRSFDVKRVLTTLATRHGTASGGLCTVFGLRGPDGATFVGASPETLVFKTGSDVHVAALAGTVARSSTEDGERHAENCADQSAEQYLVSSAKERREHDLVVEALRAAVAPLCSDRLVADGTRVRKFSNVQHLETALHGRLRNSAHILDVVAALHPTPAVGGTPAKAALDWLATHEDFDRGWYAGPIGWFDTHGDGHFVVALRSALLRGSCAWAFAGAGITSGSDPAAEWHETALKLRTMADVLVEEEAQVGTT